MTPGFEINEMEGENKYNNNYELRDEYSQGTGEMENTYRDEMEMENVNNENESESWVHNVASRVHDHRTMGSLKYPTMRKAINQMYSIATRRLPYIGIRGRNPGTAGYGSRLPYNYNNPRNNYFNVNNYSPYRHRYHHHHHYPYGYDYSNQQSGGYDAGVAEPQSSFAGQDTAPMP
jgi:hypothetical protein